MIFVTVGTTYYPFHRLAEVVNKYVSKNTKEIVIIQSGHTKTFKSAPNVTKNSFYPLGKMQSFLKTAHIVVTQAGEGSVLQALTLSKNPPIVVPRNPKFGEHVDNQQIEIASVLKSKGLALVLEEPADLTKTIINYHSLSKKIKRYNFDNAERKKIVSYLRDYVQNSR